MSDVQSAIEDLVQEQVESRIDDAISESNEIQGIRNDVETLTSRLDDDIIEEVMKQVLIRFVSSLDNGAYTFVKKSEINRLHDKINELSKKEVA